MGWKDHLALRKVPDIGVEAAPFGLDLEKGLGVSNGCSNLTPMADNARILSQALDIFFLILGNTAIVIAFQGTGKVGLLG